MEDLCKKIIEINENKKSSKGKNKDGYHDSMRAILLKKSIEEGICALRLKKLDKNEINYYKTQHHDLQGENIESNELERISKKVLCPALLRILMI